MKQGKGIKQNRSGAEHFHIYYCVIFYRYCQSFGSGRGTGHQAEFQLTFDIFPLFPNFLGSYVLLNDVFTLNIKYRFTCRESDLC